MWRGSHGAEAMPPLTVSGCQKQADISTCHHRARTAQPCPEGPTHTEELPDSWVKIQAEWPHPEGTQLGAEGPAVLAQVAQGGDGR